jgi:hypothetical protein
MAWSKEATMCQCHDIYDDRACASAEHFVGVVTQCHDPRQEPAAEPDEALDAKTAIDEQRFAEMAAV